MLFKVLKRMIEKGNTEELSEKIDIFYAAGKLNEEEYNELMGITYSDNELTLKEKAAAYDILMGANSSKEVIE